MLRSLKNLERYTVEATDGDVGSVVNFLLDDEHWAIRYLVVETGALFDGRRVLISPMSFREVDWAARTFSLALTRDRIRKSPGVETNEPVSRQHELDYYRYYGYPYYWGYAGLWGANPFPVMFGRAIQDGAAAQRSDAQIRNQSGDAHLRSAAELRGYHIEGSDDGIGHVSDFIVDDESWAIRYLVVDTSNWWFGKKVLVSPHWATRVSWDDHKVFVGLSRSEIKNSPAWDASAIVNRSYEASLYDYYARPAYWTDAEPAHAPVPAPLPVSDAGTHPA